MLISIITFSEAHKVTGRTIFRLYGSRLYLSAPGGRLALPSPGAMLKQMLPLPRPNDDSLYERPGSLPGMSSFHKSVCTDGLPHLATCSNICLFIGAGRALFNLSDLPQPFLLADTFCQHVERGEQPQQSLCPEPWV